MSTASWLPVRAESAISTRSFNSSMVRRPSPAARLRISTTCSRSLSETRISGAAPGTRRPPPAAGPSVGLVVISGSATGLVDAEHLAQDVGHLAERRHATQRLRMGTRRFWVPRAAADTSARAASTAAWSRSARTCRVRSIWAGGGRGRSGRRRWARCFDRRSG